MLRNLEKHKIQGIAGAVLFVVGVTGQDFLLSDEDAGYKALWIVAIAPIGLYLLYKYLIVVFEKPMDTWKKSISKNNKTPINQDEHIEKSNHSIQTPLLKRLASSRLVGERLFMAALFFLFLGFVEPFFHNFCLLFSNYSAK